MKLIVAIAENSFEAETIVSRFGVELERLRVIDMGKEKLMLFPVADTTRLNTIELMSLKGIREIYSFTKPYKLVHKELKPENFSIRIKGKPLFGAELRLIAGFPYHHIRKDRNVLKKILKLNQKGINSFYFQILDTGKADLALVREFFPRIKKMEFNLFLTLPSPDAIEYLSNTADVLVIEASNMQDFALLREAGKSRIPLMVKKAPGATLDEFLLAVEYVMCEGNTNVILCVGGALTTDQKIVPDVISLISLKEQTYLPVVMEVNASCSGEHVPYLVKVAKDINCDGILLENYHTMG